MAKNIIFVFSKNYGTRLKNLIITTFAMHIHIIKETILSVQDSYRRIPPKEFKKTCQSVKIPELED